MNLRADTPEARAIWATVEKAAERCPEWIRPHVERVAKEYAEQIRQRLLKMEEAKPE